MGPVIIRWASMRRPLPPLTIPNGITVNQITVPDANLGPDVLYADIAPTMPPAQSQLNEQIPRAWSEGGLIENVKRAVVNGVRQALEGDTFALSQSDNLKFSVSTEYPTEEEKYPGIWVQFFIENLARSGIGEDYHCKDENGNWIDIRQWCFDGRITLTVAALSVRDCDRLSDAVMAQLAFSRTPDLIIRNPAINTNQNKGLWTELINNKYVSISLGTDKIECGGQTATDGIPWAPNKLLYENSFAIRCHGQFNIAFRHDGVYELRAINVNSAMGPAPHSWTNMQVPVHEDMSFNVSAARAAVQGFTPEVSGSAVTETPIASAMSEGSTSLTVHSDAVISTQNAQLETHVQSPHVSADSSISAQSAFSIADAESTVVSSDAVISSNIAHVQVSANTPQISAHNTYSLVFSDGKNVYQINTLKNIKGLPFTGLQHASGLAVYGSNYYVVDDTTNTVTKFSSTGMGTNVVSNLKNPKAIRFDVTGNMYVLGTVEGINKITPEGTISPIAFSDYQKPYGVAIDRQENVYYCDNHTNKVYKMTPAGVETTLAFSGITSAYALDVDSWGNVYLCDNAGKIFVLSETGEQKTLPFIGLNGPTDVCVDFDGNVYIANSGNGEILMMTPQGIQETVVTQSGIVSVAVNAFAQVNQGITNQAVPSTGMTQYRVQLIGGGGAGGRGSHTGGGGSGGGGGGLLDTGWLDIDFSTFSLSLEETGNVTFTSYNSNSIIHSLACQSGGDGSDGTVAGVPGGKGGSATSTIAGILLIDGANGGAGAPNVNDGLPESGGNGTVVGGTVGAPGGGGGAPSANYENTGGAPGGNGSISGAANEWANVASAPLNTFATGGGGSGSNAYPTWQDGSSSGGISGGNYGAGGGGGGGTGGGTAIIPDESVGGLPFASIQFR